MSYSHGLGGEIRILADQPFLSSRYNLFSPDLVLARILEGTEQPGALAQALDPRTNCRDVACYVSTLGEAFKSQPTTQQSQIRNRWGSHFNEILSLSRETDAELFHEALFHLGQRLEREGHVEQAGLVYSAIAPGAGTAPLQIIQQSQERLEVLQGGGAMGQQMEHMGRGFARQALDPGLLLGATGMGLFGKGAELIGMRLLVGARRAVPLLRAPVTQILPGLGGFALEATAFPFAINGADELLGRSVSWAHMDHRILGSWFFLGGMRMGNCLGASASRSLGVPGLQTIGSITGVGLGHGGEVLMGLKEWHGFSNFAVETFGTWANLQVAGRFSEFVFDGQISRMQRVMDLSIEGRRSSSGGERRGIKERWAEWVQSVSEGFDNMGNPPMAASAAGVAPEVAIRRSPLAPRSLSPLLSDIGHAYAKGTKGPDVVGQNNPVTLFPSGRQSFDRLRQKLRAVKRTVRIKMYLWRGDATGQALAQEVLETADRGVKVSIEKDRHSAIFEHAEFGGQSLFHPKLSVAEKIQRWALGFTLPQRHPPDIEQVPLNAELRRRLSNHPNIILDSETSSGDHSKYYDFDRDSIMVGDTNVGNEYSHHWKTYMVEIPGRHWVRRFFARRAGQIPPDFHSPIDFSFNLKGRFEIRDRMVEQIRSTRKYFIAEMAYWGDPEITRALLETAPRLQSVDLIIPAQANVQDTLNKKVMGDLWHATRGAVNVYFYPGMLHTKVFHSDGELTGLGSANANMTTVRLGETNVYLRGEDLPFHSQLLSVLRDDMAQSYRVQSEKDLKADRLKAALEYFFVKYQRGTSATR